MAKAGKKAAAAGFGAGAASFTWTDLPKVYKGGRKIVEKIAYEVEREAKINVGEMIAGYTPVNPRPPGSPTGNLRRSITTKMDGGPAAKQTAYVGTNVEYALYFEMGANGVPPRPFLANALRSAKRKYTR